MGEYLGDNLDSLLLDYLDENLDAYLDNYLDDYVLDCAYLDLSLSCIPASTDVALAGVTVVDSDNNVYFDGAFGSASVKRIKINRNSTITVSFTNPSDFSVGGNSFTFFADDSCEQIYAYSVAFSKLYGFYIDEDDADPFTRVHYINDNVDFNPVTVDVDGDSGYDAGDWSSFIESLVRPCVLNNLGSVDFFLDRMNQSLKENGDTFTLTSSQSMMVQFTKLWVRKNNDTKTFEYSFVEFDGSSCWTWANGENTRADYIYMAMYKGYINSSNGLVSQPFFTPTGLTTAQDEIDACKTQGDNWYPRTHLMHNFLEEMTWLLGKSTDCQTTFGQGYTNIANTESIDTGSTIETGAFFGSSDTTKDVKFLYVEGVWGNRWDRIAGMHCNVEELHDIWVKPYPPFNLTAEGYTKQLYKVPIGSGYTTKLAISDIGNNYTDFGASSSTHYCDYTYRSTTLSLRTPYVGGSRSNGTAAGVSYWYCGSVPAVVYTYVGASPNYIPPPTE